MASLPLGALITSWDSRTTGWMQDLCLAVDVFRLIKIIMMIIYTVVYRSSLPYHFSICGFNQRINSLAPILSIGTLLEKSKTFNCLSRTDGINQVIRSSVWWMFFYSALADPRYPYKKFLVPSSMWSESPNQIFMFHSTVYKTVRFLTYTKLV